MKQANEPAFTRAANVSQLGRWLRISRNRAEAFAADLGVLPTGTRYPAQRLITGVLGLDVPHDDIEPLTHSLMTLAEAADELGFSAEDLKDKIEAGAVVVPPMYVVGERSRRFIRSQIRSCSRNPRGKFTRHEFLPGFLMTLEELAQGAQMDLPEIQDWIETKRLVEPMHVIIEGGQKLYIRTHATAIIKQTKSAEEATVSADAPVFCGGILGQVASSAVRASQS